MKVFGDMGANARLSLIRDRFVTGHENCALRRHIDSVPLETPIQDIVDRCRVWESHADTGIRRIVNPVPERALPVYTMDEPAYVPADRVVATVAALPAGPSNLEALLCHLLPSDTAAPAESHRVRDLTETTTVRSATPRRLLPGTPVMASRARPGPVRRYWNTIVCLSCGKSGHGVSRFPEMKETFPYMLPGWLAEKVGGS